MRAIVTITSGLILLCATFAAGFWFGVREGISDGILSQAAPRGVLAAGMLRQLGHNDLESVSTRLEGEVDVGLYQSYYLSQRPLAKWLGPIWNVDAFPSETEYVRRLAKYRKQNPSKVHPDAYDALAHDTGENQDFFRELSARHRVEYAEVQKLIDQYSGAP